MKHCALRGRKDSVANQSPEPDSYWVTRSRRGTQSYMNKKDPSELNIDQMTKTDLRLLGAVSSCQHHVTVWFLQDSTGKIAKPKIKPCLSTSAHKGHNAQPSPPCLRPRVLVLANRFLHTLKP